MPKRPTFHLMLAPNCQVAVEAADVNTALTVARDARPFLEHASATLSVPDPGETESPLTCLLCQAVDSERAGRSQLVAMQKHQMEMHGLTPEHFRASVRVFCGNDGEGCYVWAVPPALAKELHLPHLSYLRATLYRMRPASTSSASPDESSVTLVFRHPCDGSETWQEVSLIDEDALAWYGYASTGEVLIWPKGEWKRVETR